MITTRTEQIITKLTQHDLNSLTLAFFNKETTGYKKKELKKIIVDTTKNYKKNYSLKSCPMFVLNTINWFAMQTSDSKQLV